MLARGVGSPVPPLLEVTAPPRAGVAEAVGSWRVRHLALLAGPPATALDADAAGARLWAFRLGRFWALLLRRLAHLDHSILDSFDTAAVRALVHCQGGLIGDRRAEYGNESCCRRDGRVAAVGACSRRQVRLEAVEADGLTAGLVFEPRKLASYLRL